MEMSSLTENQKAKVKRQNDTENQRAKVKRQNGYD